MFGLTPSELLLIFVVIATLFLADPLMQELRRLGWVGPDRGRRSKDDATATRLPYRAAKIPEVDPLVSQVAGLRRALIVTRVASVVAGLALFGLGRFHAAPPCVVERPIRPASPRAGLPFDPAQNPTAMIGERFTYPSGVGGYQVPMRFDLPAHDPTTLEGPPISATLELDLHLRVVPGQLQGTEGIWIDGVLSGTTWSAYRVPAQIRTDISGQNVAFADAVTRCCRERYGHVSLPLAALLEGSGQTVESVLADRVLDVDIADDVEVYGAGLSVCRSATTLVGAPHCVTVGARSLAER